jgi:hypothetical protein
MDILYGVPRFVDFDFPEINGQFAADRASKEKENAECR